MICGVWSLVTSRNYLKTYLKRKLISNLNALDHPNKNGLAQSIRSRTTGMLPTRSAKDYRCSFFEQLIRAIYRRQNRFLERFSLSSFRSNFEGFGGGLSFKPTFKHFETSVCNSSSRSNWFLEPRKFQIHWAKWSPIYMFGILWHGVRQGKLGAVNHLSFENKCWRRQA